MKVVLLRLVCLFFCYIWLIMPGIYECIGSNTAGEDLQTAQLIYSGNLSLNFHWELDWTRIIFFLKEPPNVSTENNHVFISPGQDVDLTCTVAGQLYPDIRWFRGTELVRDWTLFFSMINFEYLLKGNTSSNQYKRIFRNSIGIWRRRQRKLYVLCTEHCWFVIDNNSFGCWK